MAKMTLEEWEEKCFPAASYSSSSYKYVSPAVEAATHVEGSSGFGMESLYECEVCWALVREYKNHAEWHIRMVDRSIT